jgi:endonuclease/exonuclease/phosphatase family metal-dependent hydrolase
MTPHIRYTVVPVITALVAVIVGNILLSDGKMTTALLARKHTASDENHKILRVLSFNIRFGTADDGPDAWDFRKEDFAAVIKKYSPDVIGLQEVYKLHTVMSLHRTIDLLQ